MNYWSPVLDLCAIGAALVGWSLYVRALNSLADERYHRQMADAGRVAAEARLRDLLKPAIAPARLGDR